MSTADVIEGLHPQDRLLIVEALAYWASGHGSASRPADTADRRKHRAAVLAEHLLDAEGIEGSFSEAVDTEWDGSNTSPTLVMTGSDGGESDEVDA